MRMRILLACCAALALTFGVTIAAAGGPKPGHGGNSANAKKCQKGGWKHLQTSDGGTFKNQGKCVSYGAHGGTLFSPALTMTPDAVTVSGSSSTPISSTTFTVTGTGFHPNSSGTLAVAVQGSPPYLSLSFVTDGNGNLTYTSQFAYPATCVPGVLTDVWTYTDADGVTATSNPFTFTADCPVL